MERSGLFIELVTLLEWILKMIEKSIGRIIKVAKPIPELGKKGGYGFLISEDHPFVKFFFHWTGLTQTTKKFPELEEGMKVKFIPIIPGSENLYKEGVGNRGPRAIQIEVIE